MHSLYAEMGVKERGKSEKKTKTNEDRERLGISITQQEEESFSISFPELRRWDRTEVSVIHSREED